MYIYGILYIYDIELTFAFSNLIFFMDTED